MEPPLALGRYILSAVCHVRKVRYVPSFVFPEACVIQIVKMDCITKNNMNSFYHDNTNFCEKKSQSLKVFFWGCTHIQMETEMNDLKYSI